MPLRIPSVIEDAISSLIINFHSFFVFFHIILVKKNYDNTIIQVRYTVKVQYEIFLYNFGCSTGNRLNKNY